MVEIFCITTERFDSCSRLGGGNVRSTCAGDAVGKDGRVNAFEDGADHGLNFILEQIFLLRIGIVRSIKARGGWRA